MDEIVFTIGETEYIVGQIPSTPLTAALAGKWVWSTDEDESEPFDAAASAQQDAIRHAQELRGAEEEYLRSEEYQRGLYVQQQIDERRGK